MLRLCVLSLALVCAVYAETTVDPGDDSTGPVTTAEPPITEFSLDLQHVKSTTSSVVFRWDTAVPDWMKVLSFSVTAAVIDSESDAVMTYPKLPANEDYFEAEELVKDTDWKVCVTSSVRNGTAADAQVIEIKECLDSFTIPYIRDDSVVGLFIVIGTITALVLAGVISWKCAVMKQEKAAAAKAAAAEEEENEDSKKEN